MSSLKSWLFVLFFNLLLFALSVDARGGGKGSSPKSSKKGPKSKSGTSDTVAYRSNGQCYNEQHVLVNCPFSKSTLITTIVLGAIAGVLLLAAFVIWCYGRYSQKKSVKSLDPESKGIYDVPEGNRSNASLVRGDIDQKDGEVSEYDSDDESTYFDHGDEKLPKI